MKYSYNLFSHLDYLKIVHVVFFSLMDRPTPENRLNQLVLTVQGVIVASIFILTFSRLPLWPFEAVVGIIGYLTVLRFQNNPEKLFRLILIITDLAERREPYTTVIPGKIKSTKCF